MKPCHKTYKTAFLANPVKDINLQPFAKMMSFRFSPLPRDFYYNKKHNAKRYYLHRHVKLLPFLLKGVISFKDCGSTGQKDDRIRSAVSLPYQGEDKNAQKFRVSKFNRALNNQIRGELCNFILLICPPSIFKRGHIIAPRKDEEPPRRNA